MSDAATENNTEKSSSDALSVDLWSVILGCLLPRHPMHPSATISPSEDSRCGDRDLISVLEADLGDAQTLTFRRTYPIFLSGAGRSEPNGIIAQDYQRNPEASRIGDAGARYKEQIHSLPDLILLKCSVLRLIGQFLRASPNVRHALFLSVSETVAPFPQNTSLARRIMAATIDDLQGFVIPTLSASSCIRGRNSTNQDALLTHALSFAVDATRLMTLLCESDLGFTLVRTRMKTSCQQCDDTNITDASPGITVMTDLLLFSARALLRNDDYAQQTNRNLISTQWSQIVKETVVFFHLMLCQIQRICRLEEKSLITFNAMMTEADRKDIFCSICQLLLQTPSCSKGGVIVSNETKHQVELILDEIAEEEEEDRQHQSSK